MPEQSTWDKVFVGCDLLIKGQVWTVTNVRNVKGEARKITATNLKTGKEHTSQPTGEVLVERWPAPAIPKTDPVELATAVVQSRLGGEVVMESKGANDPFPRCPKRYATTGSLLSHLYVFHGVRDGWPKGYDDIEALHQRLHANAGGEGYRDHTHDLEV